MSAKQRLLDVAKALREGRHQKRFTMEDWGGLCGTPHCALGHYAARKDLQHTFRLTFTGKLRMVGVTDMPDWDRIGRYFGLSGVEAIQLFGWSGCDYAMTPQQAAEYIERFAAKKWPAEAPEMKQLKQKLEEMVPQ